MATQTQKLLDPNYLPKELRTQLQLLISANHILHYHSLVDAFGHISIRDPTNPAHYLIAGYDPGAPALISEFTDFIAYRVETSDALDPNSPKGYSERFIHGEIYKEYASVQCVVHSHSEAVIPFMSAGIQIKPVFHMAGFMGARGPETFDVTRCYQQLESTNSQQDMLIKNSVLGHHLACAFRGYGGEGVLPVVLQHKHGFTCVGGSIQRAVYRAIYLQKNCKLLKDALDLASGDEGKISFLSFDEARDCARMNEATEDKAFRLWLREVQLNPLYQNMEGAPKDLPVGGIEE
ncbi:arad-like aldolase/epimerase [Lojkania enalia]|uniref:Arad-like aldolase/epimerase n=1 Tax=Lojkania enalia TaxID=147567 RepID=A0A9P4MZR9_9PLEO|nr:arad-like aldolase/epimerase [Didymosphaeria enalia]